MKFTGPGTDLTLGLPEGHVWTGGSDTTTTGIAFTSNLPTEEVFTLPHRDRGEGVVSASRPLNYLGSLIEDFALTFAGGRVVKASAARGEAILLGDVDYSQGICAWELLLNLIQGIANIHNHLTAGPTVG